METWIIAGRAALNAHYEACLRTSALLPVENIEQRDRHAVQDALARATHDCTNKYEKGKRSFDALAGVSPDELKPLLPSFARMLRILDTALPK